MKRILVALALLAALGPLAQAAETLGDKAREAKTDAVQAKRAVGSELRRAGRAVKATGRKARQQVITRCGDGRRTVRGAAGCRGHGGVRNQR